MSFCDYKGMMIRKKKNTLFANLGNGYAQQKTSTNVLPSQFSELISTITLIQLHDIDQAIRNQIIATMSINYSIDDSAITTTTIANSREEIGRHDYDM